MNPIKKPIILIFYLLILRACQPPSSELPPPILDEKENFLSFKIDSLQVFKSPDIQLQAFSFSPLSQQDEIWVFGSQREKYKLDLCEVEWTPLEKLFGNLITNEIQKSKVWKDEFSEDIYFGCYPNGVIQYKMKKDTFSRIPISYVNAFYANEEEIFLGTRTGLYYKNRDSSKFKRADKFPIDLSVKSMQPTTSNHLLLNNGTYIYDIPKGTLTEQYTKPKYNNFKHYLMEKLPRCYYQYSYLNKDTIHWFVGPHSLYYSTDNKRLFQFSHLPDKQILQAKEDEQYLYILCNNEFYIWNKDYILNKSHLFDYQKYKLALEEWHNTKKSMYEERANWDSVLFLVNRLEKMDILVKNDCPLGHIELLMQQIDLGNDNMRKDILKAIKENEIPNKFLKTLLPKVITYFIKAFDLEVAVYYYQILQQKCPDDINFHFEQNMKLIRAIKKDMDKLKNSNLTPDAKLYNMAILNERLGQSGWFENWSYILKVRKNYENLLTKYPHSRYADKAAFALLGIQFFNEEGKLYTPEAIAAYENFIREYSHSDLIVKAKLDIIHRYLLFEGNSIEKQQFQRKAQQELMEIKQEFPKIDTMDLYKFLEEESQKPTEPFYFELNINIEKQYFDQNEPVRLHVALTNISNSPKEIELYKFAPHFSIYIPEIEKKLSFQRDSVQNYGSKKVLFASKETRKYQMVLNEKVRHWNEGDLGHYNFKKGRMYHVVIFTKNRELNSPQLKFYINE